MSNVKRIAYMKPLKESSAKSCSLLRNSGTNEDQRMDNQKWNFHVNLISKKLTK